MESSRCPVRYKKKVLMPTTWRKARRLVRQGRAIFVNDKVLGIYLKLKFDPGSYEVQEDVLGIDPGSMFDGITVLSKLDQRNIQFNHQLPIQGKLKGLIGVRGGYRRVRRLRLRHRPMRNDSRLGCKVNNTMNYYFQNRINYINRITKLYPVKYVAIEDVKFNHFKSNRGHSFSNIEVGKDRLYSYITKDLGLTLYKVKGSITKEMREIVIPDRIKTKNKSSRSFDAHCIDSLSIAMVALSELSSDKFRFIMSQYDMNMRFHKFNTSVRFIDRVAYKFRRELYKEKKKINEARYYYRYKKGGIKYNIDHYSKIKKIRVKIDETKSNHGKIWNYMYTDKVKTYKKFKAKFGGTVSFGQSRTKNLGVSKYWNGRYYKYHEVQIA